MFKKREEQLGLAVSLTVPLTVSLICLLQAMRGEGPSTPPSPPAPSRSLLPAPAARPSPPGLLCACPSG